VSEDYAGRQAVGVDLHRRRSVINHVRQTRTVDDGSLQSLQESRRRPLLHAGQGASVPVFYSCVTSVKHR